MSTPFCANCGKPLTSNQPFCPHCGALIEPVTVAEASSPPHRPDAVRLAETEFPSIPTPSIPQPGASPFPTPPVSGNPPHARIYRPRRRGRQILLLTGGILALLLLTGGGYWGWNYYTHRPITVVPKLLVRTDEGNTQHTLYLMGLSANDKVRLADETDVPHQYAGFIARADDRYSYPQHFPHAGNDGKGVFAPVQQRVAYLAQADGLSSEIRSSNVVGQNAVTVSNGSSWEYAQLSQSGGTLLISELDDQQSSSLFVVDLTGANKTVLAEGKGNLFGVLAPDGTHIVYAQQDNGSTSIKVTDSKKTNQHTLATDVRSMEAHWSQDSSKLFLSIEDGATANASGAQAVAYRAFVMDPDGQNKHELAAQGAVMQGDVAQGWMIYSLREDNNQQSLYVARLDGSEKRDLVHRSDAVNWRLTADRRTIIFSDTHNSRSTLRAVPITGGDAVELGRGDETQWLEDGNHIIVLSKRNGRTTLTRMTQRGEDQQELATGLQDVTEVEASHGQVVFNGSHNGQASLQLWDGKKLQTLNDDADGYATVTFTPDGRSVVYTAVYGTKSATTTVYKLDLATKKRDQLMDAARVVGIGW
ncbi:MAG: zinc-ribbon domain-containing protein [Herpetosiphonaceae bacterium]|nr:zinc-ribbon domain-containing protein [Herpetosiphonaceae bacterium]